MATFAQLKDENEKLRGQVADLTMRINHQMVMVGVLISTIAPDTKKVVVKGETFKQVSQELIPILTVPTGEEGKDLIIALRNPHKDNIYEEFPQLKQKEEPSPTNVVELPLKQLPSSDEKAP